MCIALNYILKQATVYGNVKTSIYAVYKYLRKLSSQESLFTGLSKKMDGIWNRYNLKSTGWIYTFGVLKCSEKFKVLDLP